MELNHQQFADVQGVSPGLEEGTVTCETLDAIVEVCKRTGIILFFDIVTGHLGRTFRVVTPNGEAPLLCRLPMLSPVSFSDAPMDSFLSPIVVERHFVENIDEAIKDDTSRIRRVTSWPIKRTFVYIDVSDYSKEKPHRQTFIIKSIVNLVDHRLLWEAVGGYFTREGLEASICIGDGYIYVFKDPVRAAAFAGFLACLIESLAARHMLSVEFHFRIGVHSGPVYCFWDPGRQNWNYLGDGINGGQRVLAAIGKETDDVVFVSDSVRRLVDGADCHDSTVLHLLKSLHNRGRRADKHGNLWRVYELNHTDFCNEKPRLNVTLDALSRDNQWIPL